jgi:hypothetical protein
MKTLHTILEEFGRNHENGECSYCPSTSDDCKKCEKMITSIQQILELVPEKRYLIDKLAVICSNIDDAVDYGYEKGLRDGFNQCRQAILTNFKGEDK